ncbi:MAG: CBS domain-containing protein [Actinobacteria bacterium]|uniref:Unannotated protein n=1 Tax=freshwater metagenome TaxID=449393 RepID=A0A6J7QF10_9ZZZZ|nr:CBS domain-containing protein [Actinomycetota bacterium]MSW40626.1 CBS domain-containing protein [Actinomycetota bacterium]
MSLITILESKGSAVITAHPDEPLLSAIETLAHHGIGALVVTMDGREIVGIVSERDVVRMLQAHGPDALLLPIREVMTTNVTCTTVDREVDELMAIMSNQRIRHIPVVDDNHHLMGMISIGDVVKRRLEDLESERAALINYITIGG